MELIYRSPFLYSLVNRLLYGRSHDARYRVIADLIPPRSTVVDLCCGPALLFRHHLRDKEVHYTGLDLSPNFVDSLNENGGHGILWDVRSNKPLPRADYVIIQGSLYFFLPDPRPLIDRMLAAANQQVIVAEPIRNLSTSKLPFLSAVARATAGAVPGNHPTRFTEETLDLLFARYRPELKESFKIPGGRDKVYVLESGAGLR